MLCVPVYDFLLSRKIHKTTMVAFVVVLLGMLLSVIISATETGKDLASSHFLE